MGDIPMLQGWYDQLKPGLNSLSSGVGRLINPNFAVQEELKRRIAADPSLIQKLSDQEAMNPGSVSKAFGSQVNTILGGPSASAQSELELRNGAKTEDLYKGNARQQGLARDVTGANANENVLQSNNAKVSTAQVSPKVKEAQLADKQADVDFSTFDARNRVDAKKLQVAGQQLDDESKRLETKLKNDPMLASADIAGMARRVAKGQPTQQDTMIMTAVEGDPERAKAVHALIEGYQKKDENDLRWAIHNRSSAQTDRQLNAEVYQLAKQMNLAGNMDAVRAYITDPAASKHAQDLADGKVKPTTELEKGLLAVEQRQRELQTKAQTDLSAKQQNEEIQAKKYRIGLGAAINTQLAKMKSTNDSQQRAGDIGQLNQLLNEATGGKYQYVYHDNKHGFDQDVGFVQVDPKTGIGTPVDVNVVQKELYKDPNANKAPSDDPVTSAWRAASIGERRANLAKLPPDKRKQQEANLRKNGIEF